MIPKVKIFENVFPDSSTGHRSTFRDQNLVKLRKVVWITTHKKTLAPLDSSQPAPILPKMGRSHPKFPERCHPMTYPRILNLVRIGCAFQTCSGKIDFSAHNKLTEGNCTDITLT